MNTTKSLKTGNIAGAMDVTLTYLFGTQAQHMINQHLDMSCMQCTTTHAMDAKKQCIKPNYDG
jgi:hypothetical protein